MCSDFKETEKEEVIGYKLVAKNRETGEFYSILTGEKYPDDEDIPHWFSQKNCIIPIFHNMLAENQETHDQWIESNCPDTHCWEKEMVGRSSVFKTLENAQWLKNRFDSCKMKDLNKYEIVIVKCKITKDILKAIYDGMKIYVGRRLEILEEDKSKFYYATGVVFFKK